MARKSKADRINEIIKSNPVLKRDDSRINDLIEAEGQLRKAQRAARTSDVIASSAAGSAKRHPALVALEQADKSVRRLRNDLQIDRLGVKRNEHAGVKTKRSPSFDKILEIFGPQYKENRGLCPRVRLLSWLLTVSRLRTCLLTPKSYSVTTWRRRRTL
jgi:phage terminase small subunit